MNRREMIRLSAAAAVGSGTAEALTLDSIRRSPSRVETAEGSSDILVDRKWIGDVCKTRAVDRGQKPARVKEIVLFSIRHDLPAETPLYGESFQMLTQTAGTIGSPVDLRLFGAETLQNSAT